MQRTKFSRDFKLEAVRSVLVILAYYSCRYWSKLRRYLAHQFCYPPDRPDFADRQDKGGIIGEPGTRIAKSVFTA